MQHITLLELYQTEISCGRQTTTIVVQSVHYLYIHVCPVYKSVLQTLAKTLPLFCHTQSSKSSRMDICSITQKVHWGHPGTSQIMLHAIQERAPPKSGLILGTADTQGVVPIGRLPIYSVCCTMRAMHIHDCQHGRHGILSLTIPLLPADKAATLLRLIACL